MRILLLNIRPGLYKPADVLSDLDQYYLLLDALIQRQLWLKFDKVHFLLSLSSYSIYVDTPSMVIQIVYRTRIK